MSSSGKGDEEKVRYWQRTISEAARSGMSIREFCQRHRLRESQFHWGGTTSSRVGSNAYCAGRQFLRDSEFCFDE